MCIQIGQKSRTIWVTIWCQLKYGKSGKQKAPNWKERRKETFTPKIINARILTKCTHFHNDDDDDDDGNYDADVYDDGNNVVYDDDDNVDASCLGLNGLSLYGLGLYGLISYGLTV